MASWRKFLPDWEVREWNEKSFDIEKACPFVREAYEQKKWAFVSDYIRMWALYEQGGLYLDTDMEIVGDVGEFLKKPMFFGREYEESDRDLINGAVIWAAKPKNKYIKKILGFYDSQPGFDAEVMFNYAIPKVITKVLEKYKCVSDEDGVEVFDGDVWVYPKEYFYPMSFDGSQSFRTDKTVMVHHYDATWFDAGSKRDLWMKRNVPGVVLGLMAVLRRGKKFAGRMKRAAVWRGRSFLSVHLKKDQRLRKLERDIGSYKQHYIVLSQPKWLGVSHAADEMLGGYVPIMETDIYTKSEIDRMARVIVGSRRKLVVFNGLAFGWDRLIEAIKAKDESVKIKVLHHGAEARMAFDTESHVLPLMIKMHKKGLIDELGFVKTGQAEFYAKKGFKTGLVLNTVRVADADRKKYLAEKVQREGEVKLGLYCSLGWVKNQYTQLAAASLVEGAKLDCVPLDWGLRDFADKLGLPITGQEGNVPRDEVYRRMAANDVNLYVTFVECSPLTPLESMELGVPCITGNNHHYWTGTPLEEYLVVNRPDDVMAIYEQIEKVLANREKIMKLYREWKTKYDKEAYESAEKFLQ